MYCHGCEEAFNAKDRRPKLLPCGHAFCPQCAQGLEPTKCTVDNLEFEAAAEELPDHLTGLQLATGPAEAAHFWCLVCKKAAVERCLDEHAVSRLKEAADAAPLLETLRRALLQSEDTAPRWKERPNKVLDDEEPPAWEWHIGSSYPQCLDVNDVAPTESFQEMSTLLTDGRLTQARALAGLTCSSAPTWAQKVLQQAAPRLEALELFSPQQRHLDLAVAMPRLRALDVHCTFYAPLPVVAYPAMALQWLRCGVYPLAAALALVRANAETLEELHLVAATDEPYGCPDLAAELSRCGLKKLRRLVLLRQTAQDEVCFHSKVSCEAQKTELWVVFVDSGLSPSLLCSECDPKES